MLPAIENALLDLSVELSIDEIPIVDAPAERLWLWSDLHLSDPSTVLTWNRPFRDVEQMNHHLLRNWERRVGAEDTIIVVGDVAHPDAWLDTRLMRDLQDCPGQRWLVVGNHDRDREALGRAGFTRICAAAICGTDPPLVLTHIPLVKVPAGTVNVHGHLHKAPPISDEHLNVSVEHTDYAPVGAAYLLDVVRRRAGQRRRERPARVRLSL